jgi:hypothetical protein
MSTPLAEALLTIEEHPLCSIASERQGDDLMPWFYVENGDNDDYTNAEDLAATLASYDETQAPYRLTVLLPAEEDAFAYA